MTKLIVNGDDFGLSDGICQAIRELLESGAISNTTIMAAVPDARERCLRWDAPSLGGVAGVHLQLSGGRPLSPPSDIPTLVDSRGLFRRAQQQSEAEPAEVEEEWRRQVMWVGDLLGTTPTHLDSHHGVHRLPNCMDVYLRLASEFGLPVRGGGDAVNERMMALGIAGSTILLREWTGRGLGAIALMDLLVGQATTATPDEVLEVVTHPGYVDDDLERVSSLTQGRESDRLAIVELSRTKWLAANGFQLVAYPTFSAAHPLEPSPRHGHDGID